MTSLISTLLSLTLIAACASEPDAPHDIVPCNASAWRDVGFTAVEPGQLCERGMASPPKAYPYVPFRICPQVVTDLIASDGTTAVFADAQVMLFPDGLWGMFFSVPPNAYTYADKPDAVPPWTFLECEVQPPQGPECAASPSTEPAGQMLPVCP